MVGIAQLVRAPGCGPGGHGFDSHYSPHRKSPCLCKGFFSEIRSCGTSEIACGSEIRLRRVKCAAARGGFVSFHILRSRIFHNARQRIISHSPQGEYFTVKQRIQQKGRLLPWGAACFSIWDKGKTDQGSLSRAALSRSSTLLMLRSQPLAREAMAGVFLEGRRLRMVPRTSPTPVA